MVPSVNLDIAEPVLPKINTTMSQEETDDPCSGKKSGVEATMWKYVTSLAKIKHSEKVSSAKNVNVKALRSLKQVNITDLMNNRSKRSKGASHGGENIIRPETGG